MRELLIKLFFTFLESVFLYRMIDELLICKFKGFKKTMFLSMAILIDTLFVQLCHLRLSMLRTLLFTAISLVIVQSLYKDSIFIKIFFILLNNYIFIISDMITGNLLSWICKINVRNVISGVSGLTISFSILSKITAFLLVFSYIRFFKKIDFNIPTKYWISMDLITEFFIILINFFMIIEGTLQNENFQYSVQIVRMSLYFLLMSVLMIYLFGRICLFYQKEKQMYALKLKNKALKDQLAFQEASASELKKIRHDIKNNLANISYLLKENHIEESVGYINAITSTLESTKSIIHCGNNYLDSILNYEMTLCKNNNIDACFEIDNIPKLNIAPTDLSSIISNVLNNAVEANLKLTESERYISLKIFCYKNYLSIIVKNPYKHILIEDNGTLITNKKDKFYHGYGLKSVESSVKRYRGNFKYSYENNIFMSMIILPLNPNSD
ncbi:ATP-binding protein [Acidilutibacter cellobiosedens]|uniref:ATP-binding protein n=3 Tax=Acidilutibacter cellobiosedens TaxID=2507161 RepID=A0A410QBL4_9FIRM|nr:sensor histidine kinase [Acidilutibacter cellobiosedens]QAT61393.1 ATP-binding protein [Acidilutibacter cellobiosedens]